MEMMETDGRKKEENTYAQNPRIKRQYPPLEPIRPIPLPPPPHILQSAIFGPRSYRPHEFPLYYVYEARFFHPLLHVLERLECHAGLAFAYVDDAL